MAEDFEVEPQIESRWCWAAVSSSVDRFYAGGPRLSQCEVANKLMKVPCCDDHGPCNKDQHLEDAFASIGRPVRKVQAGFLSFDEIKREIDSHRPICVRIQWRAGGGHFVVIYGYRESKKGRKLVVVSDPSPIFANSVLEYARFVDDYQSLGAWTHTFLTQQSEGSQ